MNTTVECFNLQKKRNTRYVRYQQKLSIMIVVHKYIVFIYFHAGNCIENNKEQWSKSEQLLTY